MAEDAVIEPSLFKNRFAELKLELDNYIAEETVFVKEQNFKNERGNAILVAKEGVERFTKMKTFEEKVNFLRNGISSIIVSWNENDKRHSIKFVFKIHQLDNYLVSKELVVDRNSIKNGKAVSKVISEKVFLTNSMMKKGSENPNIFETGSGFAAYDEYIAS